MDNASSVTCIDITLCPNSVYNLSLDWTSVFTSPNTLATQWNSNIFRETLQIDLVRSSVFYEVTAIASINTLCFSGSNSNPLAPVGPVVDNITVAFLYTLPSALPSTSSMNGLANSKKWHERVFNWINSFIGLVRVFGFGYIISNLLNFWNLIVLYYFLGLK